VAPAGSAVAQQVTPAPPAPSASPHAAAHPPLLTRLRGFGELIRDVPGLSAFSGGRGWVYGVPLLVALIMIGAGLFRWRWPREWRVVPASGQNSPVTGRRGAARP
jgi:hypothetical protein